MTGGNKFPYCSNSQKFAHYSIDKKVRTNNLVIIPNKTLEKNVGKSMIFSHCSPKIFSRLFQCNFCINLYHFGHFSTSTPFEIYAIDVTL